VNANRASNIVRMNVAMESKNLRNPIVPPLIKQAPASRASQSGAIANFDEFYSLRNGTVL
jgi:hypothetical protein